jgi:hypothetical protein
LPLTSIRGTGNILKQLTRLEALDIQYTTVTTAGSDAGLWKSLPCLKGLSIIDAHAPVPYSETLSSFTTILLCLPPLVGLTRLELTVFAEPSKPLAVCGRLTRLTKLQQLRLELVGHGKPKDRDCIHLLHLRSLTSLVLSGTQDAVDDMVAVTLPCTMPELRYLKLVRCVIKYDSAVPAFAQLRHLTKIVLLSNAGYSSAYTDNSISYLHWMRSAAGLPKLIVEHKQ